MNKEKALFYVGLVALAIVAMAIVATWLAPAEGQQREGCKVTNIHFDVRQNLIVDYLLCDTPSGLRECLLYKASPSNPEGGGAIDCNWSGAPAPSRVENVPRFAPRENEPIPEMQPQGEVISPISYAIVGIGVVIATIGIVLSRKRRMN